MAQLLVAILVLSAVSASAKDGKLDDVVWFDKRQLALPPTPASTTNTAIYGRVTTAAANNGGIKGEGLTSATDQYILYTGNGSSFPQISQWLSFSTMVTNYASLMMSSCDQFQQPNPTIAELNSLLDSIQRVSRTTNIDIRFLFAIVLQESNGCVRAPTTNGGVRNPGLMQDHNGAWTCNDEGVVLSPCPYHYIHNMIDEGARGTSSGDGLVQALNYAHIDAEQAVAVDYYVAARIYNSGSYIGGCLQCNYGTHCYASDVANRLTGWVHAPHGCDLDAEYPGNTVPLPPGASGCIHGAGWAMC